MVKSLYFMKVANIAFYYLIDKGESYKTSFTPTEHSGSRNLLAQTGRGLFYYYL